MGSLPLAVRSVLVGAAVVAVALGLAGLAPLPVSAPSPSVSAPSTWESPSAAPPRAGPLLDPPPAAAVGDGPRGETSDVASPVTVSATPSSTEQLLPVAFAAHISASGPFVYVWDFGDGTTSADAAPAHSYIAPGTFTTVLHVIGPNDTIVGNATVSVVVAPILIAVGPNLPLEGSVGQTFHFSIDVYQGVPPYTFFWEFGDLNTSHVQNATHAYRLPGSYTATVWVNDSVGGQNIQTVSVVIPRSTPSGSGGSPSGGSIPYAWIGAGVAIVALVTGAGLWLTREPKP